MEQTLRSASMSAYCDVARRVGHDPLARQAGFDAAAPANPDDCIPAACLLLERSAEIASRPTFARQIAETRHMFGFGLANAILAQKPTLREMLLAAAKCRHLLSEVLAVYVENASDAVTIREELVIDPTTRRNRRSSSRWMCSRIPPAPCSATTGNRAPCVSVIGPPTNITFHRRFFDCTLEIGSDFNGFVCSAADLEPEPYAGSLVNSLNVAAVESMVLEVRRAIYQLLPVEQVTVERVAAHQRLSVRTMQRRLTLANTSFTRLVEEVRGELATSYMSNLRYPIGRVAALLGYAQQGSFTNWFSARFGMTPRDWRTRQSKLRCTSRNAGP